MSDKAPVFEQTYRHYLGRMADLDLPRRAAGLGARTRGSSLIIPCFGTPFTVSARGVLAPEGRQAPFSVCVVLCKYVLMCPPRLPLEGPWTAYHGFADAGPLTGYFAANVCAPIAADFGDDPESLRRAAESLGAIPYEDDAAYDLSVELTALPRIPILLRLNQRDEILPAQCTVLLRESVRHFLDMECVAMLGVCLAQRLAQAIKDGTPAD